ncbi:MAG: glycoside hydrolase domain-containing protein [Planctomycetia bacterium]
MNIIMRVAARQVAFAAALAFLGQGGWAGDGPGVPTWIKSDVTAGYAVESALEAVAVRALGPAGQRVKSSADLGAVGWNAVGEGFWETPPRSGGEKLTFQVEGLCDGRHDVYLRFFSKPKSEGEAWWYLLHASLNDRVTTLGPTMPGRKLVAGKMGQDTNTVYEVLLGTVGSAEKPANSVSIAVERYEWSQLARVGPIRIESFPDPRAPVGLSSDVINGLSSRTVKATAENGRELYWATASSMAKIRPAHAGQVGELTLEHRLRISAACGEHESRQVILFSPQGGTIDNLQVSDLVLRGDAGPESARIGRENLLLAPVGFVAEQSLDDQSLYGYWPDPIMIHVGRFPLVGNSIQALWFRVDVPDDAPAGIYEGTVSFTFDGSPVRIPASLRVFAFRLPRWSSLPLVVGGQDDEFQVSYGMMPGNIYGFPNKDPRAVFREWSRWDPPLYSLGYLPGTPPDQWIEEFPEKRIFDATLERWGEAIRASLKAAREEGMTGRPYVYLFDEADAEWRPALQQAMSYVRTHFPEVLVVTTAHAPEMAASGGIAWVPLTANYVAAEAEAVAARGAEVWLYVCNSPAPPLDNFFVTGRGSGTRRLLGWIPHACGAKGFLYYALESNRHHHSVLGNDVFTDWKVLNSGDGDLVYHGPHGRLPSQRLELIRDGLEDHCYLTMAGTVRRRLAGVEPASDWRDTLAEIDAMLQPGFTKLIDTASEGERIRRDERSRETLAEFIERAVQALGEQP